MSKGSQFAKFQQNRINNGYGEGLGNDYKPLLAGYVRYLKSFLNCRVND